MSPLGKRGAGSRRSSVSSRQLCAAHNSAVVGAHDHAADATIGTVAKRSRRCRRRGDRIHRKHPPVVCRHPANNRHLWPRERRADTGAVASTAPTCPPLARCGCPSLLALGTCSPASGADRLLPDRAFRRRPRHRDGLPSSASVIEAVVAGPRSACSHMLGSCRRSAGPIIRLRRQLLSRSTWVALMDFRTGVPSALAGIPDQI